VSYILLPSDPVESHDRLGGGKAANLARLTTAGFRVPEWFCVTTRAFEESLRRGDDATDMPDGVRNAILEELAQHGFEDRFLAVRSSGAEEDSPDDSFAGQFASFLYQKGPDAVLRAVKRCWASAFSERVLAYRKRRGLSPDRIRMGVVIQVMVDADAAGVAFSRDPVRPLDRDTLVVASVFGLGEGLVSGALDADHFQVRREGFTVSPTIADKPFAIRRAPEGGIRQEALPEHLRQSPSLTEAEVAEVARMAMDLEARFGRPQDCEWAFANGTLYCLQTRPITTLPPDDFFNGAVRGETPALWDNSNITESYSGVTLPLTFTFVRHCYQVVYRRFCEAMGIPARFLDAKATLFENLLGLIRGRVYYNLIQYYHLMALGPGVQHRREFMETMMGLKQQLRPDLAAGFDFLAAPPRYRPWELLRIAARVLWYFFFLDRAVARFRARFDAVYADVRHSDFRGLSLPEQARQYRALERAILERWVEPLIVDFFCMIFFGLLKRLTRRWVTDTDASSLQNDLLAGQQDIESTEPTRLLLTIAATVSVRDAAFRDWFLAASPTALWESLPVRDPRIHRLLLDYLDRYGFRCADELKLESRDLNQDPTFLLDVLRSYVRASPLDPATMERREEAVRLAAEATVRTRISGWRLRVYVWVLGNARRAVRHRENLRFLRTRIFGVVRRLFRAMAQHLAGVGALRDANDVFYLTLDEILAFVDGRSLLTRFGDVVELRRREFDDYHRTAAPPDRFLTLGAVGASAQHPQVLADGDLLSGDGAGDGDPNLLRGIPCFPGVVEGVVRVAQDIQDAMGVNGEILATQRTDPGWFPLYPFCSALLIERGSLLSHSAIVAREFGVPTIVGITGGMMKRLRTGQRLLVDGGRGEIRILQADGATP
jgi:phosphohistidine swiveling domain-containing protein